MTARHGVQLFADADVALYVALERSIVESRKRLKQHFDETETFSTDSANVTSGSLWVSFPVNFRSRLELRVIIQTHVAQLFSDIPSNLPLCGDSERVHAVPMKSGRNNTSAQRKCSAPMVMKFSSGGS